MWSHERDSHNLTLDTGNFGGESPELAIKDISFLPTISILPFRVDDFEKGDFDLFSDKIKGI